MMSKSRRLLQKINIFKILPKSTLLSIALLIFFFGEVVFLMWLQGVDVLPGKYVLVLLLVLAGATTLTVWLLNNNRKVSNKRLIGLITVVVTLISLNFGSYYMYNTYDTFHKISSKRVQVEKYYVLVLADGKYQNVEDIKGQKVYVTKADSKADIEAKGKLTTKADVEYKSVDTGLDLGEKLISSDGNKHDDIIFVSNGNYRLICDENKTFKLQTKAIYTITVEVPADNNSSKLNVTEDSFNLYITGIDSRGGIDEVSRSDVNMIVTINPKTKTLLLTSIPRDAYVTLHTAQQLDKLTHSGIYGVDETIQTVEDWLEIDLQHYVKINFQMFVDVVNAIGGIDVYSEYAFKSAVTDWEYEKGWNHLSGKAALYFARERKAFKDADGQRILNQQVVFKAIVEKFSNSTVLLSSYPAILDEVEDEMQTSLSDNDISALVKLTIQDLGGWKIKQQAIQCEGANMGTYSMGFGRELYVAIPDEESVEQCKEKIHEVMYPVMEKKETTD